MPLRLFITGITGYVGGDFLSVLQEAHPDWEISALIRSRHKAEQVTRTYPSVRVVLGDLESFDLIAEEVKHADIVYNFADSDHIDAAKAIAHGAAQHSPSRPLFLIHTSGAGVLTLEDRDIAVGTLRDKIWDDWDGLDEIVDGIPDEAPHRPVDKIILEVGQRCSASARTAIVCPPVIYGTGRGPCHRRSMQANWMSELVLRRQKGFLVGAGENVVSAVHVHDLTNLFVLLGDAAAAGGGSAHWGRTGYYFAANEEFEWQEMHRLVAQIAFDMDLIPSPDVERLTDQQIKDLHPSAVYAWGTNQRLRARRARVLLGWTPSRPSLRDIFPEIVQQEAQRLGLLRLDSREGRRFTRYY